MKRNKRQNFYIFAVLILAAGTVYKVPYLKSVFYDQMVSSLNVTHTQIGILSSVYAGVKMVLYIPGGILADRLNTKRCLIFSLIGESLLTAVYATLPSMVILAAIQALMAVVNIFFWTSFIKSIRILGKDQAQGKIFGFSEGLRGITGSAATFMGLQLISIFVEDNSPIRFVLWFYAVYYFAVGLLVWKLYPEHMESVSERCQSWGDYIEVFKKPAIWMVSMLIFTSYSLQVAFEYTTAYMTQVLGAAAVLAGIVATLRDNVCGMIGSPLAGSWADRRKSPTQVALRLLLIEILLCMLLILSPETSEAALPVMALILVFSAVIYGVRGVYYSTMSETGVPVTLTATATAAVAVFGYTPDMFMSLWCGRILDTYGYQGGYKRIFLLMLFFACLAVCVCLVMLWYQRKLAKKETGGFVKEQGT